MAAPAKKSNYGRILRNLAVVAAAVALVVFVLNRNKAKRDAEVQKIESNVLIPVTVVAVQQDALRSVLSITGTVVANNDIMLLSETAGRITQMYADVGTVLQAGTVVLKVDDELRRAAYMTAEAAYEQAKRDLERYENLFKEKSITGQQLEGARLQTQQAEANYIVAKRNLADTEVRAPIAGVLTSKMVNTGAMLGPGTPIGNIVDISTLKVRVNVPESEVFKLRLGMAVEVTTDVYPETKFTGTILNISPKGDEAHTYPVEVRLQNSAAQPLKAGMFARVSFTGIARGQALIVPREALVGSVRDAAVYVVEQGKAKLRKVVVGAEENQRLEILQGLVQNESVVVDGQINLQDGAAVALSKN